MSEKEKENKSEDEFKVEAVNKLADLEDAIANAESKEDREALMEAKVELEKTIEISDESKEWIKKQAERTALIEKWKEDTEYEYKKNIDIINDTLHNVLNSKVDLWYERFEGDDIVNGDVITEITDSMTFDYLMPECVEFKKVVKFTEQILSNNKEFCVWVDYKFRMDENMAMHKQWKFDITDIIRNKKTDWLFD